MMTDKEVGELWAHLRQIYSTGDGLRVNFEDDLNVQLICKLVEERARWYRENGKVNPEIQACLDFGIDPATWPGAKNRLTILDSMRKIYS